MVKYYSGDPKKDRILSALLTAKRKYDEVPFYKRMGRYQKLQTEKMLIQWMKGMITTLEK